MSDWSVQRIEQLAPDAASAKAGDGLAKPAKWQNLGRNDQLIWGECQGSGANPYQVRVDLTDVAYKCSCPSRKLPCKHTLALLMMMARGESLPIGDAPGFVAEWTANRAKRAEAKQEKAASTITAVPDPDARAKRVEKRENRIESGLTQLETWLGDMVGQGLAATRAQPAAYWSQMAARLVDAQAPGLARAVRELADAALSQTHWQASLLSRAARLQLLIDGYRNIDALPAELAAEVRTLIGWTQEKESLLARDGVRDHWQVVGRRQRQEEQLRVQYTWLHGTQSQRTALVLDFAIGNQPLAVSYVIGQVFDCELVFFDGCPQLRSLEKQRHTMLTPCYSLPAAMTIAHLQADYANRLALNPWLERWPVMLGNVRPVMVGEQMWLEDLEQRRVPVSPAFRHSWAVFALAAHDAIKMFGEWNGDVFDPLTIERNSEMFTIANLGDLPVLSKVA
jgi:hypothetical protein